MHTDLPVFGPEFQARITNDVAESIAVQPKSNGHAHPPAAQPAITAPARPSVGPQTTPTTAGASFVDNAGDGEEEGFGPDEHPPNYPRPGQGLMRTLPPEQEDLQWLVDDEDRFGVFSHIYQVDPSAANGTARGSAG